MNRVQCWASSLKPDEKSGCRRTFAFNLAQFYCPKQLEWPSEDRSSCATPKRLVALTSLCAFGPLKELASAWLGFEHVDCILRDPYLLYDPVDLHGKSVRDRTLASKTSRCPPVGRSFRPPRGNRHIECHRHQWQSCICLCDVGLDTWHPSNQKSSQEQPFIRQKKGVKTKAIFTLPKRSLLENGWYGISLNLGGTVLGPHPVGLSWISGDMNLAVISMRFPDKTFILSTCEAFSPEKRQRISGFKVALPQK